MAAAQTLRILVIDDDAVMTELLAAVLGMHGHDVVTAGSGEAALALLPSETFDVVLTDLPAAPRPAPRPRPRRGPARRPSLVQLLSATSRA